MPSNFRYLKQRKLILTWNAACFSQEEEKKVKKEEMDEALAKNKRRMLGNIKFIGELFKLKVGISNIGYRVSVLTATVHGRRFPPGIPV